MDSRGKDYVFVYSSQGKPVTINMVKISGKEVMSFWYKPKNGENKEIGKFANKGQQTFTPTASGYGQDWVLILDDASKGYNPPK